MSAIIRLDTATSTFDAAWAMVREGRLQPFDSVTAKRQSAGRGQYRRTWASPEGNLYASVRLPMEAPYMGTEAAIALAARLASSLARLGYPCRIKWPNDLALLIGGRAAKIGGILLEERGGVLVAGIGINVREHPGADTLRESTALPAGSLAEAAEERGVPLLDADTLWTALAVDIESGHADCARTWHGTASGLLLWQSETVEIVDEEERTRGTLAGIGPAGELLLRTDRGAIAALSGSLRRA